MLKVELHCHTSLDPSDRIPFTTREMVDYAARLGYGAIAVTLHDAYYDPAADRDYAAAKGVTLLAGIERTVEGKHVLLVNYPADCVRVRAFADIPSLKAEYPHGLIIAPHPFYPNPSALKGRLMNRYGHLFDAVEVNALHTRALDFNAAAIAWAKAHDKPLVGNSDLHLLDELGRTYTLVDSSPEPDAICDAIREGRVEVRTEAVSNVRAAWIFGQMVALGAAGRLRRLFGRDDRESG